MTSRKTFEAPYFKALDDDLGTFEAVVSVFGNVDYQGDRVMPGAFEDHLKTLRQKGDVLPVVWSHDWGNPFAHIGYVDPQEALEITNEQAKAKGFGDILGGLYVKGHIDMDKEFARQVYDLLKGRRVREWSFAYDVHEEERAKDHANNLLKLAVWEVGPTLKGANNMTDTITVKGIKNQLEVAQAIDVGKTMFKDALDLSTDVGLKFLDDFVAKQRERLAEDAEEDAATEEEIDAEKTTEEIADTFKGEGPGDLRGKIEPVEVIYVADEKAGFKPWHVESRDGKYCVIKDSDGSTAGCHDTREEAMSQMRALYANEPKSDVEVADFQTVITSGDGNTSNTATGLTISNVPPDDKAGRRISKESEQAIRDAIANLQALLGDPTDEPKADESEQKNTEPETPVEGAEQIAHYKAIFDSLRMDETS